jgi:hypothetical protein
MYTRRMNNMSAINLKYKISSRGACAKNMWNILKKVHVTNNARINAHYYFE